MSTLSFGNDCNEMIPPGESVLGQATGISLKEGVADLSAPMGISSFILAARSRRNGSNISGVPAQTKSLYWLIDSTTCLAYCPTCMAQTIHISGTHCYNCLCREPGSKDKRKTKRADADGGSNPLSPQSP